MTKELYNLGEMPPLGVIPPKMHAWLIRPERFGKPMEAFQKEVVNTPPIADDEVLVYVMAAGINYNNVWAGLGIPIDVIGAQQGLCPGRTRRTGALSHRWQRRLRHRLQSGQRRDQRQSRRRSSDALRPVQPRLRVGQERRRSHVLADLPHLGL